MVNNAFLTHLPWPCYAPVHSPFDHYCIKFILCMLFSNLKFIYIYFAGKVFVFVSDFVIVLTLGN